MLPPPPERGPLGFAPRCFAKGGWGLIIAVCAPRPRFNSLPRIPYGMRRAMAPSIPKGL